MPDFCFIGYNYSQSTFGRRDLKLSANHISSSLLCPWTVTNMALRELSSLEKYLGLKKPNKFSTQGDKKVI